MNNSIIMNNKYKFLVRILTLSLMILWVLPAFGQTSLKQIYVSPDGDDKNPGTIEQPLRTITAARNLIVTGTTINLREGIYHEEVALAYTGAPDRPLVIRAYNNEQVVISGGEPVTGTWTRLSGQSPVWRVKIEEEYIHQIFLNGKSMIEARWPNMKFHENWDSSKKWAYTGPGTELGHVKSSEVAALNVDLTDGLVYIKVGKGNDCFSRTVYDHQAGSDAFKWDTTEFLGTTFGAEDGDPAKIASHGLVGNEFFIIGKLGLLDASNEWYYDKEEGWLYFYPPFGLDPNNLNIEYKKRISGFKSNGSGYMKFKNLTFRGCNLDLINCDNTEIDSCRFIYPTYRFYYFNRLDNTKSFYVRPVTLTGDNNIISNCEISWAAEGGVELLGEDNLFLNNVIHDCNLHGKHPGPALKIRGPNSKVSRCTFYNCGGVGIYSVNYGPVISEYNNIFNCGIYCVDVSGYYNPWGARHYGSIVKYNWLHNIKGIGMRTDVLGKDITVHHNVVWDCDDRNCKWSGYSFGIYNNTYVAPNNTQSGLMLVLAEGASLDNFSVQNNITLYRIYERVDFQYYYDIPDNDENFSHNLVLQENDLGDHFLNAEEPFDWRPKEGSELIDAGKEIPGITDGFTGSAPDLGAYEAGGDYWFPGADWLPDTLGVPQTMPEAEILANNLQEDWLKDESPYDTVVAGAFQVKIILTDPENNPLPEATVILGGLQKFTNDSGLVIYNDVGFDAYIINTSSAGFLSKTVSSSIFSDTTLYISLSPKILKDAWITIVDKATGDPITRAVLNYMDQSVFSNSNGQVHLESVQPGNMHYSLEHRDYFFYSDSVIIEGDTSFVISMIRKEANVRFKITDGSGPVENVTVTFNNWNLPTDSEGMVLFQNQPALSTYQFTVEKNGYSVITDSLQLEIDTLVQIILSPVTANEKIPDRNILVYPNPAGNMIFIQSSDNKPIEIVLSDTNGRILINSNQNSGKTSLDLEELPAGTYIIQLKRDDVVNYKKIIKLNK